MFSSHKKKTPKNKQKVMYSRTTCINTVSHNVVYIWTTNRVVSDKTNNVLSLVCRLLPLHQDKCQTTLSHGIS